MKTTKPWTKNEWQLYVLLLCANADYDQTESELALIQSKTEPATFDKILTEFQSDSEEERFRKIDEHVQLFEFSPLEIKALKQEMLAIFSSDKYISWQEEKIAKILDNLVY